MSNKNQRSQYVDHVCAYLFQDLENYINESLENGEEDGYECINMQFFNMDVNEESNGCCFLFFQKKA